MVGDEAADEWLCGGLNMKRRGSSRTHSQESRQFSARGWGRKYEEIGDWESVRAVGIRTRG